MVRRTGSLRGWERGGNPLSWQDRNRRSNKIVGPLKKLVGVFRGTLEQKEGLDLDRRDESRRMEWGETIKKERNSTWKRKNFGYSCHSGKEKTTSPALVI